MEEILIRENGDKIKICVSFFQEGFKNKVEYRFEVTRCLKGKRTWNNVFIEDWKHRSLSMDNRRKEVEKQYLLYVTPEEVMKAKLTLWETLKPND